MVGTMIASAVFGLTAGTFAYAAVAFAANYALSYVVTRTFGSNRAPNQVDPGSRQQIPPSANNPIPVVYGDAWLGGTFVDAVLSTDNKTMYYVLVVSNISPDGQFTYDRTQFYYGDRLVTFDGTDPTKVVSLTDGAGNVDTKISGNLYINLYTSNAAGVITNVTGSAPSVVMGGADITPSLRWPASGRQMNGLAFAIVKLTYNSEAGTTGLQPLTFKVSHYLKSAGAARPGDVLEDYLKSDVYGCAVPIGNINTTACAALNTYSDQLITYIPYTGGSTTQARYRINGVLNTGENVLSNIDRILTACDSWLAYQETTGQWMPVINKAESSSFSFDDSNIIGELRVSISDITQSINQVEATFPWKGNKDQPNLIFLETPSVLMYANEPANKATVTFDLINDSVQAQYIANRMLEQAREDLIVTFSTAYPGIQVDAGDVISITNSDYGWTNKLFRAIKVSETTLPDGNLGAQIECTEYNADVYDDQNITQFTPAPNSGLNSAFFFSTLSAPTFSDQLPSAAVPSFSVTCNIPSSGRVTSITLYYTTSVSPTTSDWKVFGTEFSADSQAFTPSLAFKFTNVSLPAATYYFAFKVANDVATSQLSTVSSTITWNPTGVAGASSRICFARVSGNPVPVSGNITTSGAGSFPSSAQSLSTWGFSATWGASDPNPSSTNSLYQSDGTYDPVANLITWTTPYISSLKVGQLSAITTNTGTLTIDSTGYLRGGQTDYNTGTGFFLGYSGSAYKFSIGSSTQSLLWDGTSLTLTGNLYAVGTAKIDGTAFNSGVGYTIAADCNNTGNADIGVLGFTNNSGGFGVVGYTDTGTSFAGVQGSSSVSGAYGLVANNTGGGTALYVSGRMQITNNTLVTNLNADMVDGVNITGIVASGTQTGTYDGGTKPGSSGTTNQWLAIVIAGTTYYIPVWQ